MKTITESAQEFVESLIREKLNPAHHYHSLDHTKEVTEAADLIGSFYGLSDIEQEELKIAALFHDTGHIATEKGHEEKSAEIAQQFLSDNNYPEKQIKEVQRIILATRLEHEPTDLLENIIKDADLLHLGKKQLFKKAQLLRREWEEILDRHYSELEWWELNEKFFENFSFRTEYAREHYTNRFNKNLEKIKKRIEEEKNNMQNGENKKPAEAFDEKALKMMKKKMPERGVETVFRTTSRNHLRLSAIADNKANTLISIGALIISIILSFLVNTLDVMPSMMLSTMCLLTTCVLTIIFATLSTKPKVTENTISREDIKNRRGNLLFFGNFYKMKLEDYKWGMNELMNDKDFLYSNLMQDIYFLGLVLAKKYKYLSIAYSVFMYGIIISVLAFVLSFYLSTPDI